MDELTKHAIQSALNGNWKKAVVLNEQIIQISPKNTSALNRLAFACLKLGDYIKAAKIYEEILSFEPNHPIAEKNLDIAKCKQKLTSQQSLDNEGEKAESRLDIFLKEPGLTRLVNLVNIATQTILEQIYIGQEVNLIIKKNTIEVRTKDEDYIGALPDDLSYHLRNLSNMGNKYTAHIKNIDRSTVTILIREVKRGKQVPHPSFSNFSPL